MDKLLTGLMYAHELKNDKDQTELKYSVDSTLHTGLMELRNSDEFGQLQLDEGISIFNSGEFLGAKIRILNAVNEYWKSSPPSNNLYSAAKQVKEVEQFQIILRRPREKICNSCNGQVNNVRKTRIRLYEEYR